MSVCARLGLSARVCSHVGICATVSAFACQCMPHIYLHVSVNLCGSATLYVCLLPALGVCLCVSRPLCVLVSVGILFF